MIEIWLQWMGIRARCLRGDCGDKEAFRGLGPQIGGWLAGSLIGSGAGAFTLLS